MIRLNKKCRLIEEGNQSDINTMRINYDRVKMIRESIETTKSKAKVDYIELLEKLACFEKEQLLNLNEALTIQKEISELKDRVYPIKNDIKVADTFNSIGSIHFYLSEYNDALKYYKAALEIKLMSLPNNDSAIAEILNNIGKTYHCLDDASNSVKFLKQAMDIYESLSK